MKKCTKCLLEKDESCFYSKLHKNGKRYLRALCKECYAKYSEKYYKTYHKTEKYKKARKEARHRWLSKKENRQRAYTLDKQSRERNITTSMLYMAKKRAKVKGIDFNITKEDLLVPEICPILEIPIKFGDKSCYFNSPTLDRIDVTKGYVKGNVRIISMLANSMKNAATIEQLYIFSKNIIKYINNDDIVRPSE